MIKSIRAKVVLIVAALVFAMPLAAQTPPSPSPTVPDLPKSPVELESNTKKATAGVFTNEVDDSMDVHYFSGDENALDNPFENWIAFAGYGGSIDFNPISLGYATRFGGIYLGVWYTGNIVKSGGSESVTVNQTYSLFNQVQASKTTTTVYDSIMDSSNNQMDILIGFKGMGFKIGFWESMYRSNNVDNDAVVTETIGTGITRYEREIDGQDEYGGHIMPSLTWGMSMEAGKFVIRPKVSWAFDIYQDRYFLRTKQAYETGEEPGLESIGDSYDYLKPNFFVGAAIDLPTEEESNTTMTIDVGYGIGFSIYNNSYDEFDVSGSSKGTVAWKADRTFTTTGLPSSPTSKTTTTNVTLDINDITELDHNINLGFYWDKEVVENFTIGAYVALPFNINTKTSDKYRKNLSTTREEFTNPNFGTSYTTTEESVSKIIYNNVKDSSDPLNGDVLAPWTQETAFSFMPSISFGAKYDIFPSGYRRGGYRFQLNAGISLEPFVLTNTVTRTNSKSDIVYTTTRTVDDNGNVLFESVTQDPAAAVEDSTEDVVTTENKLDSFKAGMHGGLVFYFNNNAFIDLCLNASFNADRERGDYARQFIFDITAFSVMFTLMF